MPNLKNYGSGTHTKMAKLHDTAKIRTPQTPLHVCFPIPNIDVSSKPQVINKILHDSESRWRMQIQRWERLRGKHVPWKLLEEDRELQIALYIRYDIEDL
ncbi:hypothetical protein VTP01DRAFT_970 [Rhizomucor pusillus]|uniref:uncharacterized protein n=1 Tax=Rhizomucor pusillus TaxID=4840 RepID=UPI0037434ACA